MAQHKLHSDRVTPLVGKHMSSRRNCGLFLCPTLQSIRLLSASSKGSQMRFTLEKEKDSQKDIAGEIAGDVRFSYTLYGEKLF